MFLRFVLIFALLLQSSFALSAQKKSFSKGYYSTLDERYNDYFALASAYPSLVSIEVIGKSVKGKDILLLKIGEPSSAGRKAEALITGNIHACEFLGGTMAFELAKQLASNYGHNPFITSMVDRVAFYIVPTVNPDGFEIAMRHLSTGFTARRTNANNVDLNRNFPYPEGIKRKGYRAGSKSRIMPTYMGKMPLSEPESRAIASLAKSHNFFAAVNLHTTGGLFLYPYAYKPEPAVDKELFMAMGKAFNEHQLKYLYQVRQSYDWYQTVGDLNDWLYINHGILSVTIELAKPDNRLLNPLRVYNPFWWYNPVNIFQWVDNDRDAVIYSIETALELTGGVPRPAQKGKWIGGL